MFHDFMWGPGWGPFPWIIIGLVIWLIVNATNKKREYRDIQPSIETPLDILKKRYAKGEISKEQFDQMKKDLE